MILQIITTVVSVGLLLIDMLQTLDIKNHKGMYEINKVLGKHPSDIKVYSYFTAWCVAVTWFGLYATQLWPALLILIAIQLITVTNNIKLGLKL